MSTEQFRELRDVGIMHIGVVDHQPRECVLHSLRVRYESDGLVDVLEILPCLHGQLKWVLDVLEPCDD